MRKNGHSSIASNYLLVASFSLLRFLRSLKVFQISLMIMIIVHISTESFAYRDTTLDMHRNEIIESIHSAMIKNDICVSPKECRVQERFFIGSGRDNLSITTYGFSDSVVLSEIINICANKYLDLKGSVSINIKIYAYSKDEWMRRFSWNRDVLYEINFSKGGNDAQR